ncbi:MAG: ligase, partial [Bacilli bacterium]|nr:ligase [Bacilli bacterium]
FDLLSRIIRPSPRIQKVDSHPNAQALFKVMQQQGMEGIVVKKTNSLYQLGGKTDAWLKVKYYRDVIAVIGGYTIGGGAVNAILLGLYDAQGQLWYIGHTGTGKLSKREWRELLDQLAPTVVPERPFVNLPERHRDAYWVEPRYTVKVNYAEWTEGNALRQPSIQSFVDVSPRDCVFTDEMMRT